MVGKLHFEFIMYILRRNFGRLFILPSVTLLIIFFMFFMNCSSPKNDQELNNMKNHSKLYVVTRSTHKFKIGGQDNPTVGLFTTTDFGKNWQHYGWYYTKCFSVAIEPGSNGKILYLSCGNGVQKSIDSGDNWKITTGWEMTECLKVAIDPLNPQNVYSATAYGIFKSENGGESWQEKNKGFESTFTSSVIIDRKKTDHIFAATEAGIYLSDNGAGDWKLIGLQGKGIRTIRQSSGLPETFMVGTEDDGIFMTFDSGQTWQQFNNGLTHLTIYALAFDPNNENILYTGTFKGGVYKSENNGQSWRQINKGLDIIDIHALIVDPKNSDIVYCGTLGGGVYLSENRGEEWQFIGLETSQVWDFLIE